MAVSVYISMPVKAQGESEMISMALFMVLSLVSYIPFVRIVQ